MTLSEKQRLFTYLLSKLIQFAYGHGYELTLGEAYRTPEQAEANAKRGKGIANSLHCQRLAIDLNLFRDGKYLTASEQYQPLGGYWKSLHELCRWGGDFTSIKDGNHFSIEHEGRM